MKILSSAWILAIVMLLSPGLQAKEVIYKWTDKNGVVHYSSHPPAGQKAEKVKVVGRKGTSVDISKKADRQPQPAPEQQQQAVAPPAEVEPPPSRKNPEHCEQAKKNLWNLENYPRLRIEDPETGERRMMSDDERQQYLDEANKQIKEFCDE
ncbi:DUF4124 domain-containing protein [Porticoccus sp. W117]|uniref:DUF4124 domain-containing protein n=1 Tax=Porticoccus sp. W117 TaxID=3054777 RepID=UPI002595D75B|nr:DUF4124 domain-containing protein [Porticoccus sp. W117]MDM3871983.1 DUF4124 domain-containing protein [Porticoccus sp. W117]